MESAIVPAIYDPTLADEDLRVDTERRLPDGAPAGARGRAAGRASRRAPRSRRCSTWRARLERGVIVTVFPDGAEKYLTESFWTRDD